MSFRTTSALVTPYLAQLDAIAHAWLAQGATSFSVWIGEKVLRTWPPEASAPASAYVQVMVHAHPFCELRISGIAPDIAVLRLHADAACIGQLIRLEDDLDTVAAEIIDIQDQLIALFNMSRSTRRILDTSDLLLTLTRKIVSLSKVETAFTAIMRDGEALIAQVDGDQYDTALFDGWLRSMIANGTDLLIDSTSTACSRQTTIHTMFLTPITLRGRVAGVLGLINKPSGFQSPDIKLAHAIAEQAGAQIEHILLHEEMMARTRWQTEMELARQVQERLLPRSFPRIAGVEIEARSHPALEVGGDFFDLIEIPEKHITFSVSDISGKGMPAAIIMAMTRTVLRSKATFLAAPCPGMIMRRANEDLYADFTDLGMFDTSFIGQYDPYTRRLMYANAGHSPVIYCPAAGTPILLEADGLPMGVLEDTLAQTQSLMLHPNDILVVATDGFPEARNAFGDMFGYERLLACVDTHRNESAADMLNTLFDTIAAWSGTSTQDDDQTVMIIKGRHTSHE